MSHFIELQGAYYYAQEPESLWFGPSLVAGVTKFNPDGSNPYHYKSRLILGGGAKYFVRETPEELMQILEDAIQTQSNPAILSPRRLP